MGLQLASVHGWKLLILGTEAATKVRGVNIGNRPWSLAYYIMARDGPEKSV